METLSKIVMFRILLKPSSVSTMLNVRALLGLWLLGLLPAAVHGQVTLEPDNGFHIEIDSRDSQSGLEQEDEQPELTPEEVAAIQARAEEINRELVARQNAIQAMQSDLGIYSPALQEAYSDFGAFYNEIEDFESAVGLHSDALQVARINNGLYSPEQLPIIAALIRNNRELQAWDEVDNLYELNYFVASRAYSPSDAQYISSVEEYGRWKLRVIRENKLDLSSRSLLDKTTELSAFYGRVLNSADALPDSEPERLLGIVTAKTQTDLTLARSIASTPYTAFQGTVSQFVTQTRCRNSRNAQGQTSRQCVNVQVENPRYRQSQRDAKSIALRRYTRQIESSIERMRNVRMNSESLSVAEQQSLDSQIAELETESIQLNRSGRRIFTF